ncbi:MAG: Rne/Rng family ribonuclease [Acidobacteriia bacterium]|nr:Rne/Rng family ribonuclease [Terriglobia bacterium]
MSQDLVISSNPIETTVAIRENDRLAEIHVERHGNKAIVGNIYKGRVTRVLPGMQSAFVDIGLERDAFLYVTDVAPSAAPEIETADDVAAAPAPPEPGMPVDEPGDSGPEPSSPAAAQASDEDASDGSRGRSRRGRRRGRRAQADKPAESASEPGPEDPVAEIAEADAPADHPRRRMTLLPGESLAKYQGDSGAEAPEGAVADSAPSESAIESASEADGAADGEPSASAADDGEATAADAVSDGSGRPADDGALEPPENSAKLDPPSILAQFWNPLKWLKKGSDDAPKAPPAGPRGDGRPSRSRRRRPARAAGDRRAAGARRGESGQRADAPAAEPQRRRSGRRQSDAKRPQRPQARQGARSDRPRARETKPVEPPQPPPNIADLLESGQEVIVQVSKEPVGAKGARITCHISLPGHYMVYMTSGEHNGVTKQIQSESERRRLRKLVDKHSEGKDGGFVVRTSCGGVGDDELLADMEELHVLWGEICEKAGQVKAPAQLHSDLDIGERVLREHLSEDFKAVWVDSKEDHKRIAKFVERFQPNLAERVKLYTKKQPIHDAFGITKDLKKALRPKVWLKSGGYLVINQTEALVAIDVNTGRYVGQSDRLEDTVLKTNLEAAEEIVRQLRLRDLGGIIVVDFIDMEDRKSRQQVHQMIQEALRKMRSPSRVLPFNDFGLVVITRKSVRQSLERSLCTPCPACSGAGTVKSSETVMSEIFSAASRQAKNGDSDAEAPEKGLTLRVHPEVAKSLKKKGTHLDTLQTVVGATVTVRGDVSMHPENFSLR